MVNLEEIKRLLADRNAAAVAEATGLSALTIREIRNGAQSNPSWHTLWVLNNYLKGAGDQRD